MYAIRSYYGMKVEIKDRDDVSVVILTGFFTMNIGDNTFYAWIYLNVNGKETRIDARPSDALAIASYNFV